MTTASHANSNLSQLTHLYQTTKGIYAQIMYLCFNPRVSKLGVL